VSPSDPFPAYPGNRLSREDVVAYLLECQSNEWCQIYRSGSSTEFILELDCDEKLFVYFGRIPRPNEDQWAHRDTAWFVDYEARGCRCTAGRAETLGQLEKALSQAAVFVNKQWRTKRSTARFSETTPATNLATFSRLIGTATIRAVHDPFLDNKGLANLLSILTLGPSSVANNVRMLACEKMTRGPRPGLTKTFVADWLRELGITAGEVRLMPDKKHRRFLLLGGGQSLIFGMSLNNIAKDEAAHLESDTEDTTFFDSMWATATPLP
jgi:hypothetical protein